MRADFRRAGGAILWLGLFVAGCGNAQSTSGAASTSEATSSPPPSESVAASASSSAAPVASSSSAPGSSNGPMVSVPAGTLQVGDACGAVPRVTDEEVVHTPAELGAFSIDVYPYPNDPDKPAKTGVTRDEAKQLCEASGKRLCSELEWERACKGASDSMYEYTGNYDPGACRALPTLKPNERPKCVSAFGVKDMHGLVYEWTSSPWGRGTTELVATRGTFGKNDVVRDRCASGQGKSPGEASKEIGFRCCSGDANGGTVELKVTRDPPLSEDPKIDSALAAAMLKEMPKDHQTVTDATVSFDKLWRWHPRPDEELLLGRWTGHPKTGLPWFEIVVFKVCGTTPNHVASMRGPVGKLGGPTVGTNTEQVSLDVETKNEKTTDKGSVRLDYWYGSVRVEQPPFVKVGNEIVPEKKKETIPKPGIVPPRLPIQPLQKK